MFNDQKPSNTIMIPTLNITPTHFQESQQQLTPFHLSKQQSISEIAPETHRSSHNNMLQSSLDNIYGLALMEEVATVNDHHHHQRMMLLETSNSMQTLPRFQYDNNHQLMHNHSSTKQIGQGHNFNQQANNTTTEIIDFFTTEGDEILDLQPPTTSTQIRRIIEEDRPQPYHMRGSKTVTARQCQVYQDDEINEYEQNAVNLVVWGRNQCGQLGIDPRQQSVIKIPMQVNRLLKSNIAEVKQVACGKAHTLLLIQTQNGQGQLYSFGSNKQGQLGASSQSMPSSFSTEPILVFNDSVIKIACSKNSSYAILTSEIQDQQMLYAWGSSKDGVLGIDTQQECIPTPKRVDIGNVIDISAGKAHAGAIVKSKSAINELSLYMWGDNKYGQLGLSDYETRRTPTQVKLMEPSQPVALTCGYTFTILQMSNNEVYSCGQNIQGQLGLQNGQQTHISKSSTFQQLITNYEVDKIVASDFTCLLTTKGELYLWGPTPVGQFNQPKSLQEILQGKSSTQLGTIRDISIGTQFGIIQDTRQQCFQLGQLFHDTSTKRNYDSSSSTTALDHLQQLPPLTKFCCGNDFVIASLLPSSNQQNESNRQAYIKRNQTVAQNNTSRSLGNYYPKKQTQIMRQNQIFMESSIDTSSKNGFNPSQGRYIGFNHFRDVQNQNNQSICSNSLSPLRKSMIEPFTGGCSNNNINGGSTTARRDLSNPLNRSLILPGSALKSATGNQLSLIKGANRESCTTPVRDSTQLHHPIYHTIDHNHNNDQNQHRDQQQQHHLDMSSQHQVVMANMSLDIMIREKQELQHSLNVEIQRRLMMERELSDIEKKHALSMQQVEQRLQDKVQLVEQEKQTEQERLKDKINEMEKEGEELRGDKEIVNSKLEQATAEIESLKAQLTLATSAASSAQTANHSYEQEQLAKKAKEIFDLTVQLGTLREENHQLRKDHSDMKEHYEERLQAQQQRAQTDYDQLMEEYKLFQEQCTSEQTKIEELEKTKEELQSKIKKLQEKLKQYQAQGKRLPFNKVIDPLRASDQSIHFSEHLSNYTSVLTNSKQQLYSSNSNPLAATANEQNNNNSFNSIASRKSKKSTVVNKNEPLGEIATTTLPVAQQAVQVLEKENTLDSTPTTATIIQQPSIAKSLAQKKQHQQLTSHNLFKKQTPLQTIDNGANKSPTINIRTNNNRDQGCLQVVTTNDKINGNFRKKSAGVMSAVASSIANSSHQNSVQQTTTVKNNVKKNIQTVRDTQPVSGGIKASQKTPTRLQTIGGGGTVVMKDQTYRRNNVNNLNKSPSLQQSFLTSSFTNIQQQQAPQRNTRPCTAALHTKQKSSISQPVYQFNNEEQSIFDMQQQLLKVDLLRQSNANSNNSSKLSTKHVQDITLGGCMAVSGCHQISTTRSLSPPGTPQMASIDLQQHRNMIVSGAGGNDFTTTQSYVVIGTGASTPKHQLQGNHEGNSNHNELASSSNSAHHGHIMSEMRTKLLDIQNNKQYIEQKIQEYEKKLQQLRGTTSTLGLGTHSALHSHSVFGTGDNVFNSSHYFQGQQYNNQQQQNNMMNKSSSSGLLMLAGSGMNKR